MINILYAIFWMTILLSASSYFLYPIVLHSVGKIKKINIKKSNVNPCISVIIPAYNEEKSIERKIQNTLELDYPEDKIEILIGSDGSTDKTSDIVNKYSSHGVKYFDYKNNRGKTAVQNDLVESSSGQILVFTDAASFLPETALTKLIQNFADERVGCVAGKMQFIDTDKNLTTQSQGLYWRYEVALRDMESQLGSLIGVDGPLYAVRRENYIKLENQMISDLMTPLLVLKQGKKVILEPDALVNEEPTLKTKDEFNTRRRITLRGLTGIFSHKSLLNPMKYPLLSMQILFHKVIRWFVGPLVVLNGLSALLLTASVFFRLYLILYSLFFILAAAGWLAQMMGINVKVLSVPYYFVLVNSAATFGVIDYVRKKKVISWKPVRN